MSEPRYEVRISRELVRSFFTDGPKSGGVVTFSGCPPEGAELVGARLDTFKGQLVLLFGAMGSEAGSEVIETCPAVHTTPAVPLGGCFHGPVQNT